MLNDSFHLDPPFPNHTQKSWLRQLVHVHKYICIHTHTLICIELYTLCELIDTYTYPGRNIETVSILAQSMQQQFVYTDPSRLD